MKYLLCLGLPLLLQALLTLVFSQAGSSGSFVDLEALLFAVIGIPLTLIINFALIRSYPALVIPGAYKALHIVTGIRSISPEVRH